MNSQSSNNYIKRVLLVGAYLEAGDSSSTVGSPNNLATNAGTAYVFSHPPLPVQ